MAKQTAAIGILYDRIYFKSHLELFMYKQFKLHKIPFSYEAQTFDLSEEFTFKNSSYERFLNGKGKFKDRGKNKLYPIRVYTPDFTSPKGKPLRWVVEVKGRAFPDFSRTWTLFKFLITKKQWDTILFVPRDQKDCMTVIATLYDKGLICVEESP